MEKPTIVDYKNASNVRNKSVSGHNSCDERFKGEHETTAKSRKKDNWQGVASAVVAILYVATGAMAQKLGNEFNAALEESSTLKTYIEDFNQEYITPYTSLTSTKDGKVYNYDAIANKLVESNLSQASYLAMYKTLGEYNTDQVLSRIPTAPYKTVEENLTANGYGDDVKSWENSVKKGLLLENELDSMFPGDSQKEGSETKGLGGK